jgi:hypothetical protein
MYTFDTNTNTAIERQADRVRAVQAYGLRQGHEQAAPAWTADSPRRTSSVAGKATLALAAAAASALLVVWGLMAH